MIFIASQEGCMTMKSLDKIRGCLIGGAAGDALGYAVEFLDEHSIFHKYGKQGITRYQLHDGEALISDDTQMTLFTAAGLLCGTTRGRMRGIMSSYTDYIACSYRDWFQTQNRSASSGSKSFPASWLMNEPRLYSLRAPGNTCLSAIQQGCSGTIERAINQSKGCGGVMRVAPIGLYLSTYKTEDEIDRIGAEAAALTHGHEMGYIPAAMLVHIVRMVSQSDGITLKEAVLDAQRAMDRLFPGANSLYSFQRLIDHAVALSERDTDDLPAIHQLGEGWVGDEALAIAIYCALRYEHDFDKAIIASVNHRGDSDSTGAITGNILGAHLGLSAIPQKYIDHLELSDVILEIANDLYHDCPVNEFRDRRNPEIAKWLQKYVEMTYHL